MKTDMRLTINRTEEERRRMGHIRSVGAEVMKCRNLAMKMKGIRVLQMDLFDNSRGGMRFPLW